MFFSDSWSNRFSPAKGEPRTKKKTTGEGAKWDGSDKNLLHSTPWDFWNAPSSLARKSLAYAWCDIFWGLKAIEKYVRYGLRKILSKHLNVLSWIKLIRFKWPVNEVSATYSVILSARLKLLYKSDCLLMVDCRRPSHYMLIIDLKAFLMFLLRTK